jgi:ABC-type amino acid transport substrate-binding protein
MALIRVFSGMNRSLCPHHALMLGAMALLLGGVACTADQPDSSGQSPAPAGSMLARAEGANGGSYPGSGSMESALYPARSRPVLTSTSEVAVDEGDPLSRLRREGRARVVVLYVPSEGWAYEGAEGRLTGVTVEILRDFFAWTEAREGGRLEVVWTPDDDWARFYRRVRNGAHGVFGLGNVTITQERRAEVDFSPPYLNNVAVLITHESVPELPSMEAAAEAFQGFTALPYRGTLHEERVNRLRERRIPGLKVRVMESNDEILQGVSEGTDRMAWVDGYAFWRAVERGAPLRRHPAGDDSSETFGVILPRGSDWTLLLEQFFEEEGGYRNQTRYRDLLVEHLGPGLTELLESARLAESRSR